MPGLAVQLGCSGLCCLRCVDVEGRVRLDVAHVAADAVVGTLYRSPHQSCSIVCRDFDIAYSSGCRFLY
jgi:hypothetical protein